MKMDKIPCIYKIKHKLDCKDENIYIGSTYDLNDRKRAHKTRCNNERDPKYNFNIYKYMRHNGGYDNFEYSILRLCEDEDKSERHKLEQSFIDVHRPTLNTYNAKGKNVEKRKEWQKEKIVCDCGSIGSQQGIARHKKSKKHLEHLENLEDEKIALRLLNGINYLHLQNQNPKHPPTPNPKHY
tara:strand:- start:472 stop:1020 length:549 start_codon:yes stop_codon:yes gene_type:complete